MNKDQLQVLKADTNELIEDIKRVDTKESRLLHDVLTNAESGVYAFLKGADELIKENDKLTIGIVGRVKAGKSSFLNSLFFDGEDILPKAATPMTAGLTIIEYADENTFEVEYFSKDDWAVFEMAAAQYTESEREIRNSPEAKDKTESIILKELKKCTTDMQQSAYEMLEQCKRSAAEGKVGSEKEIRPFRDQSDLEQILEDYVGAHGKYTAVVKSLHIKKNDPRLHGLRIVDTPGVNDPVVSRETRTREFLRTCHGVFLLSFSTQFFSAEDVAFLKNRIGSQGISEVLVLASKFDLVLNEVGAGWSMNGEEGCSLYEAVEELLMKFKKDIHERCRDAGIQIDASKALDFTSGIGYSIAKKGPSSWNESEKLVIKKMREYFPDDFKTEEELLENFLTLANIDRIRSEYLEGSFLENKESIVKKKTDAYFAENQKGIRKLISTELDRIRADRNRLEKVEKDEVERQLELEARLFKDLQDKFNEPLKAFQNNLQGVSIKKIYEEEAKLNVETDVEYESTKEVISHKIWFTTMKNTFDLQKINTSKTLKRSENKIKEYISTWRDRWSAAFEEQKDKLIEAFITQISEQEKADSSLTFDSAYYRGLFDRVISNQIDAQKTLELNDIQQKTISNITDSINKVNYVYNCKSTPKSDVKRVANIVIQEEVEKVLTEINTAYEVLKTEAKKAANKEAEKVTETIEKLKKNIANKLQKEGKNYLDHLKVQLESKMVELKKFDKLVSSLEMLNKLYSKQL